jgi:ABC-type bacteriocin/lantibiotic exporter with double-glycine peptidase domain
MNKHIKQLQNFDQERKSWLVLSAFVAVGVLGVMFGWNAVQTNHLIWVVSSLGLVVAVAWWYWTMRLIRHLIEHKIVESTILQEIVEDIRHIRDEVKNIPKD